MSPQDFCYWLQGFFEVAEPRTLSAKQTAMIREHLALVFENVTAENLKISPELDLICSKLEEDPTEEGPTVDIPRPTGNGSLWSVSSIPGYNPCTGGRYC